MVESRDLFLALDAELCSEDKRYPLVKDEGQLLLIEASAWIKAGRHHP